MDYEPVMYQVGLIDELQLEYVNLQTQLTRNAIESKQYLGSLCTVQSNIG